MLTSGCSSVTHRSSTTTTDWDGVSSRETLIVDQFGASEEFVFNRVMVRDVTEQAPISGTIDLKGPPS